MADWRDIPNESIEPDAPARSIDAFALRDNPIAIAEGAPGAPRVASGALKTAQASTTIGISGTWPAGGGVVNQAVVGVLAGGQFAFLPETDYDAINNGSSGLVNIAESYWGNRRTGTSNQGFALRCWGDFRAEAETASSGSAYRTQVTFRSQYFQSSPPYNHGDGDIYGYIYASISSGGHISSLYVSEDPPWYGNTKHSPDAQWKDPHTGQEFQMKRHPIFTKDDLNSGAVSFSDFIERAGEYKEVIEKITPDVKMRGMNEMPCPFAPDNGCSVVMLDPMDPCVEKVIKMMQSGENVKSLFDDGYLKIGSDPIKRKGPPGVAVHGISWRSS